MMLKRRIHIQSFISALIVQHVIFEELSCLLNIRVVCIYKSQTSKIIEPGE